MMGGVTDASAFDPGEPRQRRYHGYGPAPLPDPRDGPVTRYLSGLRAGGPGAVAAALRTASQAGRAVLGAYAGRQAALAVRRRDPDPLVSALVALVVAGLDRNDPEALMPMALVDDAAGRIGVPLADLVERAAAVVGPAGDNLRGWLTRAPADRTPQSMGYRADADATGFRYRWAG